MQYKRVNKSLNKGNILLPVNEEYFDKLFEFMEKDPEADYYESIYTYSDEHKKTFDESGSLAGIKNITTNKLVFDFDSKENVDLARKDAVELCSRLVSKGVIADSIQISYSGSKGYHIVLDTTDSFTRKQCENVMKNLGQDLTTLDFKITDEQRILRLPLTKHPKTNLYKIPLTLDQLTDLKLEDVQTLSKAILDEHYEILNTWNQIELPKSILEYKNIPEKTKEKTKVETNLDKPDFNSKPRHLTPAKFALQEGFYESGERHEALMILASTYRGLGYNKDIAYNMLKATNRLQSERTGQDKFDANEIWLNIVEYVYSPKWKGGTYSDKENPTLLKIIKKFDIKEDVEFKDIKVSSIEDVSKRFVNFAENIDKNRIELGMGDMDEDLIITTGMTVGLLGCPGSGKTSHILNVVEHNILKGNHCFFGSHDMYDALLYTRLLQKYCNYDMQVILSMIQNKSMDKKLKDAWEQVRVNFRNVGFNFQSSPTPEDIFRSIDEYEQKSGEKVKLLVVDYLEKINSGMSDPTAGSGYAASKLIDGAKDRDICSFILLQSQKSSGDASDPLLSMRKIKGASLIEQNLRVILSTWRPGFNPGNNNVDDKYCSFAILKNTMGPVGKYDFRFDGLTGRTRALTAEEEQDFNRVEREQKDRKNQSSGSTDLF